MDKTILILAGIATFGASTIYAEQVVFPDAATNQTLVDGTPSEVLRKLDHHGISEFLRLAGKETQDSEHFSEISGLISGSEFKTDLAIFDDHVLNITVAASPADGDQTRLSFEAKMPPSALTHSELLSEEDIELLESIAAFVAQEYALNVLKDREINKLAQQRLRRELGISNSEFNALTGRLSEAVEHAYKNEISSARNRGIENEYSYDEPMQGAITVEEAAQRAIDAANEEEESDWYDGGWSDEAVN